MREIDRPFLCTLLALLAIGLLVVYSACQGEDPTVANLWIRQIVFAVAGLVAFAACAAVPPAVWERLAPLLYAGAVASLVAVVLIGSSAGGATRWLSLGGVRFQPSEVAKLGACLLLARILAARRRPPAHIVALLGPLSIVLVPAAFVLRQPDLGTAILFLVAVPPMLYWSGVSLRYLLLALSPAISVVCASSTASWIVFSIALLALAYHSRALILERILFVGGSVAAGIITPLLWGRLEAYQRQRIIAFLDPESYSSGAGYQIIQSKVAIGSGGLAGMGFLEGTQKGLAFLPARHTDFIFSVVGEEFGYVGTMAVLALFTFLVIRGFRIAASSRDPFAGLVVVGIMSIFAFQVFVNIGMTVGLFPVTGVPLPILSYGGTSLLATMAGLGIVLGVGLRRKD
jgi:rod shape determining protein RodA